MILKYEGDIKKAQGELAKILKEKTAEAKAEKPQPDPAAATPQKKSILH